MSADPSIIQTRGDFIKDTDIVFGRVVVPVPGAKKGERGEYMEHCFIGDAIILTLENGNQVAPSDHKFTLSNGLALTYGQINGLAGDFYGTSKPISDGADAQDRSERFIDAYDTLATDTTRQPDEAQAILAVLQTEVDAVNQALANGQDPSVAYAKLPDMSYTLERITWGRQGIPGYLGLALINWDHFGADARTAYNVGHAIALQKAITGDLDGAYSMNAFADHFLEDSFSAGHLRTPRRLLHKSGDLTADACAKFMHDEDCAIGLKVNNPAGESWTCYGDKRMLDKEDADNMKRCVQAVQFSANEVYEAFISKKAPSPTEYAAWKIAPTLESAQSVTQELAPLFTFKGERRKDLKKRRVKEFKKNWWFWSTAAECKISGLWNYPITIDAVEYLMARWSDICIISYGNGSLEVVYQSSGGSLISSRNVEGAWSQNDDLFAEAVRFTPLALINWNEGSQICVYYLDSDYILQEHCYSSGKGWSTGSLGKMKIVAAYDTRIAATCYEPGPYICIYLQEKDCLNIREIYYDGEHWYMGSILSPALRGTSISALTVYKNKYPQTHVYFQKDDLSLTEFCHNQKGWSQGEWNPGMVRRASPINAITWLDGNGEAVIRAYWRDNNEIVMNEHRGTSWTSASTVLTDPGFAKPDFQFAVMQWANGQNLRVYWQGHDIVLREYRSDDAGQSWSASALVPGTIE